MGASKDLMEKVVHGAHVGYGYTLKEIAGNLRVHYTTVSRIIRWIGGKSNIARPDPYFLFLFILLMALPASPQGNKKNVHMCNDCHTTHLGRFFSNPSFLKSSYANSICINCHNGSNADASDVIAPIRGHATPGGYFMGIHTVSAAGHDLGVGGIMLENRPPTLTCITCHDPHENGNFRSLRLNLSMGSSGVSPSKGKSMPENQVIAKIERARMEGFGRRGRRVIYISGMSRWCEQCHLDLYMNVGQGEKHHPVDVLVGVLKTRIDSWPATIPLEDPNADTNLGPPVSGIADDRIMCLTCHYAHGFNTRKALRYADGVTMKSTCNLCHQKLP